MTPAVNTQPREKPGTKARLVRVPARGRSRRAAGAGGGGMARSAAAALTVMERSRADCGEGSHNPPTAHCHRQSSTVHNSVSVKLL